MSMTLANYDIKKVLVDNGSSMNALFYDAFSWMKLSKNQLKRISTPLIDFPRDSIEVESEITLLNMARSPP